MDKLIKMTVWDRFFRNYFPDLRKMARSGSLILISGEEGTEKAELALLIHELSRVRDSPFAVLRCTGSNAVGLFSSGGERMELKSEFRKLWPFLKRWSTGGSVFLDRIERLDRKGQFCLQDILERKNSRRGGDITSPPFRFILGSSSDLAELVSRGLFLSQLYYTVLVLKMEIPPLRARREAIIPLARLILGKRGERLLDPAMKRSLTSHDWPGNFAELKRFLAEAVSGIRNTGGAGKEITGRFPARQVLPAAVTS